MGYTAVPSHGYQVHLEFLVPKGSNSGVKLEGLYEIQIFDSYGVPDSKLTASHCGGIYPRAELLPRYHYLDKGFPPTANACKPPGEWQTLDITFVDRHVTVILNGKRIIDNQPIAGCTGGALWSDPLRPGPIYLQGDHTGVNYRNIVLRPVLKAQ